MRFSITAGLLASGVAAFSDSSPFVLFSTSELPLPESNPQLRSTSQIIQTTQSLLASCPTSRYVLIAQPNLHASDFRDAHTGKCLAPQLCAHSSASRIQSRFDVAEVVGPDMSVEDLRGSIEAACTEQGRVGKVVDYKLDGLPSSGRSEAMAAMDEMLGRILEGEEKEAEGYTVIYFSSPHEASLRNYESNFDEPGVAPMELKRRAAGIVGEEGVARRADNGNISSSAPLFVKYQFFTPGIFMGLVGTIIMLTMLYVGLSAVSSLQVSYGAFDKENGPAAQKKNM